MALQPYPDMGNGSTMKSRLIKDIMVIWHVEGNFTSSGCLSPPSCDASPTRLTTLCNQVLSAPCIATKRP
jgi:hypothetical protein